MIWMWIPLIGACILLAGYYAGTETGFYRLNRVRLRFRLRAGDAAALRLAAVVRRDDAFVVTTLVGNNVFVFLATLICTQLYEPAYGSRAEFMATMTLMGPIFLFGEVLQKEIFRRAADVLMYRAATMLQWTMRVFAPVVFVLRQVQRFWSTFLLRSPSQREALLERRRLYHYFHESAEEGTLSAYQRVMAGNIMRLKELSVERVMIPRQVAVSVQLSRSLDEFRELVEVSPYRRLPAVDEAGRLVGVVNVLDVLSHGEGPFDLRSHLREATLFAPGTNVINALHRLKRSRQPMGFVRNDDGEVLGIVTIKDLVEEIVGELGAW